MSTTSGAARSYPKRSSRAPTGRAFIPADHPLELSTEDYFANRDPLLELVLARPLEGAGC